MADDDSTGTSHRQDMAGIDLRKWDLRIVRIDTAQDQAMIQLGHGLAHPGRENAGAGTEIAGDWLFSRNSNCTICVTEHLPYDFNLLNQLAITQCPGGLVVHGMVAEFIALPDQILQDGFSSRHM